jgi:sulfatase modifying factor 1
MLRIYLMNKIVIGILLVVVSFTFAYMLTQPAQDAELRPKETVAIEENAETELACAQAPGDADEMIWLEGGTFSMGSSDFYPDEGPMNKVEVDGFWIDKYEVTNAQFATFIDRTDYVTVAEQQLNPNDFPGIPPDQLTPGSVVFIMPTKVSQGSSLNDWWRFMPGANWRQPNGPGSNIDGKENYPAIHVAYEDAKAYADWSGRTLPTEAQWEYAARGGLQNKAFAWGDEYREEDGWRANTWQGTFPAFNEGGDGHLATAPTGCFAANEYGIHDMIGNVWEWVDDWYYPGHEDVDTSTIPTGYDPRQPDVAVKVIKGGSYLCAKNFCMRYRPSARHAQEANLSAAHIGFRTVKNKKES